MADYDKRMVGDISMRLYQFHFGAWADADLKTLDLEVTADVFVPNAAIFAIQGTLVNGDVGMWSIGLPGHSQFSITQASSTSFVIAQDTGQDLTDVRISIYIPLQKVVTPKKGFESATLADVVY